MTSPAPDGGSRTIIPRSCYAKVTNRSLAAGPATHLCLHGRQRDHQLPPPRPDSGRLRRGRCPQRMRGESVLARHRRPRIRHLFEQARSVAAGPQSTATEPSIFGPANPSSIDTGFSIFDRDGSDERLTDRLFEDSPSRRGNRPETHRRQKSSNPEPRASELRTRSSLIA